MPNIKGMLHRNGIYANVFGVGFFYTDVASHVKKNILEMKTTILF